MARDASAAVAVTRLPLDPRRTPCVGICSTTYGDLVCRGCKRFAHEVVDWNQYQQAQREQVWARLLTLLAQSVRVHVRVIDEDRLRDVASQAGIPDSAVLPAEVLAFQTMSARPLPLPTLGLAARAASRGLPNGADGAEADTWDGGDMATRDMARAIDGEFQLRSRAYYEASFKTLT